ncbi:hypothetical protein CPER28S_00954 [Cellulomonas persica]|uniref:DUF3152 domain-containing protein n=1 Tax=Cellulomonas persica TaxID=76861 RepID=A0A510UV48_9CELL|nr:hypothetical protein CPE01_07430 [Cellulomonas persica]
MSRGRSATPGTARRHVRQPVRKGLAVVVAAAALVAGGGAGWFASGGVATPAGAVAGTGPTVTAPTTVPVDVLAHDATRERSSGVSRGGAERDVPSVDPTPVVAPSDLDPGLSAGAESVPVVTLPPGLTADDVAAGLLSDDVPQHASGQLVVVPGSQSGPGTGKVTRIRVEVEDGLAVDGERFAAAVMATLNDRRGWGADGSVSFERTDGDADLRVVLASPDLVDRMCAPLATGGKVSCGRNGHAVLNLLRWVEGSPAYGDDRASYRHYLVNHEVGHLLGHRHQTCPGAGRVAPLMQQQSYSVTPCTPNPWPFRDD